MPLLLYIIIIALVSFSITSYLIPLFISIAYKLNIIDRPDGHLKTHAIPVAYLGGAAIYGGFIVALALFLPFKNQEFLFFIGITLLLYIGLIDDILSLNPLQKLLGQIIATICFLKAGLFIKEIFFGAYNSYSSSLLKVISFTWALTIINAFNRIDIMDGLATIIALSAGIGFLAISYWMNLIGICVLLCSLLGALLAFFLINKPPASMYLGDTGSLFLGGFFAAIPFMIPWGTYTRYGMFTPLIILAIPLCEVTMLVLLRSSKGIPFYRGSPHHFMHYLKLKGWTTRNIIWLVAINGCILNILAFLFFIGFASTMQALLILLLLLLLWVWLIYS